MSNIEFYIIRHGETLYNLLKRIQGWSDTPLTDRGIESAKKTGLKLKDIKFDAVYSSDASRAVKTANFIVEQNKLSSDLQVCTDKRLREWCFGDFEGCKTSEMFNLLSKELGAMNLSQMNSQLPKITECITGKDTSNWAESFETIKSRIISFFNDMVVKYEKQGGKILVITHAFLIKSIIYCYDKRMLSHFENINNSSVIKLVYSNKEFCFKK